MIALPAVGFIAPNIVLTRLVARRREKIRRSIPDAIDLLVICVDAGLGIDQALLRVGQELGISHPQITEELLQINREQRAGKPRIEAWADMAARSELEDIDAFAIHAAADGAVWDADCAGAEHLCGHHPDEAAAACGRDGGEDDGEDHLSAGAVYLSQHVYRAAGAGGADDHARDGGDDAVNGGRPHASGRGADKEGSR
jgi:hypothetical protein